MQTASSEKWFMIVNPNAGVKKGTKDWPKILRLLQKENVDFDFQTTTGRGHAIEIASESILNGCMNICVVGGDGTLNEALNGIMGQQLVSSSEITLGIIPVGTGNDWSRMFNVPFDYLRAIHILKQKTTFLQDAGRVTYYHNAEQLSRFFMNVAGMGYDALVAKKTNLLKEKGLGGPLSYMYFVFASLFQYKFIETVIEVDGIQAFSGGLFSMNVGICKYNGGGMMQVPHAIPDDGLLDVTLIKKASKWMVVRHARKLFDGSLVNLPMVATFRGETIRISSTEKLFLETDGESLGHSPLTFEVLPRCVRVVTGGTSPP
ncbi:MAG: diacylglycerol kinase family lipid kinase [Bacteroidales bacterium]|nr:diacylglycerol kinase family lipid kinase [Bacteroidales bacterium]